METNQSEDKSKSFRLSLFTWIIVLLASDLPNAIWQAVLGEPPAWFFVAKIGMLLGFILVSLVWKPVRIVRSFFFLLLVLMLALRGMDWLRGTDLYSQWEKRVNWVVAMAGFQLLKLLVVSIMVIVLRMMDRKWKDFFLTRGQLGEAVTTSKAAHKTGKHPISWGILALILGLCIAPLTLLFFGLGNLPASNILLNALPYFPAVLVFALTNSFSEEMQFRASLLSDLQKVIGADQAIWLTATFFGFAHYFGGAPAGIPGVLIAGLLGALFAKCMVGSKGIVVPWFIHFCQNTIIYAFWAIGWVS
jgi:CAAX protease family protein